MRYLRVPDSSANHALGIFDANRNNDCDMPSFWPVDTFASERARPLQRLPGWLMNRIRGLHQRPDATGIALQDFFPQHY